MPASTPRAIVEKLNAAIEKSIDEPEFHRRLDDAGSELTLSSPEEFEAFVRSEKIKWRKRLTEFGLTGK